MGSLLHSRDDLGDAILTVESEGCVLRLATAGQHSDGVILHNSVGHVGKVAAWSLIKPRKVG